LVWSLPNGNWSGAIMPPNTSLMLTRLAAENAVVPSLLSCP
jgi:hypothetical protein